MTMGKDLAVEAMRGQKIDVLPVEGHDQPGFVRLVDFMGGDLSVVRAARVSYNADWRAGEDEDKDAKLVRYLWNNRHTTPFESVVFTFEVKAPVFVFRQWHRHRTQAYNEMSGRYVELDEGFYVPAVGTYGQQSKSSKQAREFSHGFDGIDGEQVLREERWHREQLEFMNDALALYRKHLAEGMPKELARIILPFATYSRMFTTVSLRNLFHFMDLRLHAHAQHEISVYPKAILKLIEPVVPVALGAFMLGRH